MLNVDLIKRNQSPNIKQEGLKLLISSPKAVISQA